MYRKRIASALHLLLPRSLWIAILYALLSCISLIAPQARPTQPRTSRLRQHSRQISRAAVTRMLAVSRRLPLRRAPQHLTERQQLGKSLGCSDIPDLPAPDLNEVLVLCYGIPVVPWLKRIGIRQWQNWLDHLGKTLRARYPDCPEIQPGEAWDDWLQRHVRYVESHFARLAGVRLAQLLSSLPSEFDGIYLFGHSAGGSAIMQYLADLRDGQAPEPAIPIHTVLTLNSAVAGPARLWTGWPSDNERPPLIDRLFPKIRARLQINESLPRWRWHVSWGRTYQQLPFRGLGSWAQDQGICMLTVSNVADFFGHRALDDIPYVGMHIGRRSDLKNALNGKTHLAIQRDPRVPRFIWWHDAIS